VAAISVGLAQASRDTARGLLATQQRSFSAKRWSRIGDEFDRLDAALGHQRLMYRRAAWRMDQGLAAARESSMAKATAPPVAEQVILRALQLMGADGYSAVHLVEKWYRDVKIMDIFEGTGNIQRLVITRHLFGSGPRA
jgi:alkylation response protein AidB-like acyl-CoA dehydrogenase